MKTITDKRGFKLRPLDIDDIKTYPPEGECLFFILKPSEGLWDRFYGERGGFIVFTNLHGLTFRLDQIRAWAPSGFDTTLLIHNEEGKLNG